MSNKIQNEPARKMSKTKKNNRRTHQKNEISKNSLRFDHW
ncbi:MULTISPECIES: 50S ribosomal protein L32 [unclassified Enterococcus]|nr:50S ribosomal protein L32 [Enterococcus sp. S52]MBK0071825.1 50S ribosomal protein L32 [Enterococcus sp. S53]MBK0142052.1 50S ribosomal protein L32 [Enterococcus sp. S76]MBK0145805.1 50S ribosomal protein L32 [Enterococcus sp. S77]